MTLCVLNSHALSTSLFAETKAVLSSGGDAPPVSRVDRVQRLSYAVYYRTLSRLQSVQEQVYASLKQLKISVDLVRIDIRMELLIVANLCEL